MATDLHVHHPVSMLPYWQDWVCDGVSFELSIEKEFNIVCIRQYVLQYFPQYEGDGLCWAIFSSQIGWYIPLWICQQELVPGALIFLLMEWT